MSSLGLGKGAVGKVRAGGGWLVVRSVGWLPLGTDAVFFPFAASLVADAVAVMQGRKTA